MKFNLIQQFGKIIFINSLDKTTVKLSNICNYFFSRNLKQVSSKLNNISKSTRPDQKQQEQLSSSLINNQINLQKNLQSTQTLNEIQQDIQTRYIFKRKEGQLIREISEKEDQSQKQIQQQNDFNSNIKISKPQQFVNQKLKLLNQQERLSKYLSRSGVCSRRQAEKLISQGLIKVDGKTVTTNIPISVKNEIKLFTKNGEKIPIKQNTLIYLFYKPKNLSCQKDDQFNRPTIYQYIQENTKINVDHIIPIGKLDFNAEGLMLLTNNGDLASCLESQDIQFERVYSVRVHGMLDQKKFLKMNQPIIIKNQELGPFSVKIERRQTSNTWLQLTMNSGKIREFRKVMQKLNLQIDRLKRIQYGPYSAGSLLPGGIIQTSLKEDVKRQLYLHLRHKLINFNQQEKVMFLEKFGQEVSQSLPLQEETDRKLKYLPQETLQSQLQQKHQQPKIQGYKQKKMLSQNKD